ncbi:hypothetical protein [uncultured Enterococcus sp.]|uniref:hypothetical protein n=1 Tax=uncultured Enterococcus sp. TaxID=167972 RepID=UPI0022D5D8BF|nr:hypothetical protein [uncultured Enterococcus sp.]CAI3402766.1 hypothetical protein CIRMBP1197_01540 [Enterococcus cecorum]
MALNAKQRETRALAEQILTVLGKDYDEELDRFHNEIVSENISFIMKALNKYKNVEKKERGTHEQIFPSISKEKDENDSY